MVVVVVLVGIFFKEVMLMPLDAEKSFFLNFPCVTNNLGFLRDVT